MPSHRMRTARPILIKSYSVDHHTNFSKIYNNGNTPELLYYTYIPQLVYHIRRHSWDLV